MFEESVFMSKVIVVNKKQLRLIGLGVLLMVLVYSFWMWNQVESAAGTPSEARVVHMMTGEFTTTGKDGKKMEAYRWDPGTIVVKEGEHVELRIWGMNGDTHPFIIEGLGIKGEIHKGQETVISFHAKKEGIYRIVCLTHHDTAHEGPMVGYIVVD
jgi:heme/copper-type cytochrome/quinol oxidase subunit 2